jgi:hypothetical protein
MSSDSKRPIYLTYLFIAIALGMLVIAVYYTFEAVLALQGGLTQGVMTQLMTGLFGIMVSFYMFLQFRKRITLIKPPAPSKMFSVIECQQCGFKNLRTFTKSDFVYKSVGACGKCKEPMIISGIYAEKEEKK